MKSLENFSQSRLIALPLAVFLAVASPTLAHGVTVLSTSPSNGATNTATSTNGSNNILSGTVVSAAFTVPMDPSTLNSPQPGNLLTFTVSDPSGSNVPGTVALNSTNTTAAFTPSSSALTPNRRYTALITIAARSASGVAMASPVQWSFTTNANPYTSQAPVSLGSAGTFAILTKSGITDVYASAVTGDVGTSPITGAALHLTCTEVSGNILTVDAAGPLPCRIPSATLLTAAIGDMGFAYVDAAGRSIPDFTELGAGEIGGLTLVPGLYKWGTGVLISTNVTLAGGPNDVWIFQIAGTLKEANAARVILARGALAKNIFWQVGDAVAIGTTAHFEGVLLGKKLIAVKTGASANGRLFAQTAVTLQKNAITEPAK